MKSKHFNLKFLLLDHLLDGYIFFILSDNALVVFTILLEMHGRECCS